MHRLLLPLFSLISITACAQPLRLTLDQLKKVTTLATQDVPPQAPGTATAIISNGEVIFEKYAGFADLTDSLYIDERSRFNIASNGKQFTALAILLLADARKLSLDDDIRKFLPDALPLVKQPITVRNLLNHSSGIRDFYDLLSLQGITWWKQSFSNDDVLSLVKKQEALNFDPGSRSLYSNTNYVLLAEIVEKVSGESFVSFTSKMFRRLNMPSTTFVDNAAQINGPVARAYFNFNTWKNYDWTWNACGDGNLFSTLRDQMQWELILQGAARSGIKRKVIEQSQQLADNNIKTYGFGLEFGEHKSMPYLFHEGATGAWKASVLRFPSRKISIITLTNSGKVIPSMLSRQMADVVFGLAENTTSNVAKPSGDGMLVSDAEITGVYMNENNFAFQFMLKDGKMFLRRSGRNDVELTREGNNLLQQKFDADFKQEFTRNANGQLQVTAYHPSHAPYTLTKVTSDLSGFSKSALNGRYTNAETGVSLVLRSTDGEEFEIERSADQKTKGLLITPSRMLMDNYVVDFTADGLLLSGDRLRQVAFRKEQ